MDRLIFVGLYRLVPSTLKALTLVKPETVVRWHRAGFRSHWRRKSRPRSGRPPVPAEIRRLIRPRSGSPISSPRPAAGTKSLIIWSGTAMEPMVRYLSAASIHRHSRPPDVAALPMAKCACRTADRFDPQGMHRSYRDIWRTPSGPRAAVVQGHAHSPVIEQGRADITHRRNSRTRYQPSDPGRTAPSISPDLIYGRHSRYNV
jgi:hypothetical protein